MNICNIKKQPVNQVRLALERAIRAYRENPGFTKFAEYMARHHGLDSSNDTRTVAMLYRAAEKESHRRPKRTGNYEEDMKWEQANEDLLSERLNCCAPLKAYLSAPSGGEKDARLREWCEWENVGLRELAKMEGGQS